MTTNNEVFGKTELKPLVKPEYVKGSSNYEKWLAFHKANPHICSILIEQAFNLKTRGFEHCGISLLWERLRWLSYVETYGVDEYRLSNNHRAYYARHIMEVEPELAGFFRTKPQPAEGE